MATTATQPAAVFEEETPSRNLTRKEKQAAARAKLQELGYDVKPAYKPEKSLMRLIMESDMYEWKPVAVLLLTQLVALAMDADSKYPKDAPEEFQGENKVGWCWMTQLELSHRCRCDEKTIYNWIARFRKDGVIDYRDWYDDNHTHHAEYRVVPTVFLVRQRPENKHDADKVRPSRYEKGTRKANSGSFSKKNQPTISATRRALLEEDDE